MNLRLLRIVAVALIALLGTVLYVWLRVAGQRGDLERTYGLTDPFMKCLPAETTPQQREEIQGILTRFYVRARSGEVRPQDAEEIEARMTRVIERGSIAKTELHELMALVSHYTYLLDPERNPPDGSGIHPLLQKDTTATPTGDR